MPHLLMIFFLGLLSIAAVRIKDVETILDNPEKYQGQQVIVSGRVKEVIGPKVVVIQSGKFLNNAIEVTGDERLPAGALQKGAEIQVTGKVTTVPRMKAGKVPAPGDETRVEKEVIGKNTMIMVDRVKVL